MGVTFTAGAWRVLGLAAVAWMIEAPASNGPTVATVLMRTSQMPAAIALPAPRHDSDFSLERALERRRSVREFRDAPLTLPEISQVLWAAQGITNADGLRTAPSAGALYPLELYIVIGAVRDLSPGIYHYEPRRHVLIPTGTGDRRRELAARALGQGSVADAAAVLVFTAVERRTTHKYGGRGTRYVHIEVGHAAQNVLLQATAWGLGAVVVGAFDDAGVSGLLKLPQGEAPLYLVPLGRP